jgi:gamma-glutamyltranspeptidase/glutathione hydrolase
VPEGGEARGDGGRLGVSERELAARGRRFAIATPHVDATAAGLAAFDAGGNAVDAALAAATTLAVVAPHMCGVGGDLFALVREPEGRTVVVNASGAAPALVDVDEIRREHSAMPPHGPLTVTVPGAVSGWWQLGFHWSELGFAAAFGAAIGLARDGVAVSRTLAEDLSAEAPRLLEDAGLAGVFSSGGRPLREGDRLVQPALARTLETIAEAGPPSVYRGVIGLALADHLAGLGSAMRLEDLSAHEAELDSPLTLRYRDLDVSVPPPNSQGFVLLEALAAIERLGIDPDPLGPDAGALAEVFRVTSADRDRHNADPRHARVPVGTLLDEGHLAGLVDQVSERTGALPTQRGGDTIALVAADASGLAVALVQSLFDGFGSGILEPATGIVLHSRGSAFSLDPEHPNVLAGGKRPSHTLLPVVVHRDGRLVALAGTMGGGGQPQIDAMSLVRAFDLGMDAASAVAAPRWLVGGMALDIQGRTLVAESRLPHRTRDVLEAAGYAIDTVGEEDGAVGHAHLLLMREDGTIEAGSDPRADGGAAAR